MNKLETKVVNYLIESTKCEIPLELFSKIIYILLLLPKLEAEDRSILITQIAKDLEVK